MSNIINIEKQVQESIKNLPNGNYMLGKGLMQPFRPANSGSRALMNSIHDEHLMIPSIGEVPIVQTGYETQFGMHSSSYVESKSNYRVVAKFNKFDYSDSHYYLIVQDIDTGIYDVIERVEYKHNTESYGYLWNNNRLDKLNVGDTIQKGSVLKTSIGFDPYGNKMNGVNLTTLYLSCGQNLEDSIIISESAAKKLQTNLIVDTSITINDNDVLLNLYGDINHYKTFPDIGESVKDGILCSIRRIENENILYSLSQSRLTESMISDRNILVGGTVVDINIYCNNPELLSESYYNQQLYYYYLQRTKLCKSIVDFLSSIAMNGKMSYNLSKLYSICRDSIGEMKFFKEKQFSNIIMEVTLIEPLPMNRGDKMSDRYGGKGVVSKVVPDALMPRLDNGTIVEVIKNQSTCINRENLGQLHEQSLTFIGMRIIDFLKETHLPATESIKIIHDLIYMIDENQAKELEECINMEDPFECGIFVDSIIENDCIVLSSEPFTTKVNLDTIAKIYERFPWIKPYKVMMPIEDSNGNTRFVPARRELIVGRIYNYRLKQFAEEKFSVTSLSATNLKGLNTRSRANKIHETKYTKTPIMFGAMESSDLAHLGMQYVVMNLMLYSSSPQARRLFQQLLVGDPYDIDIKLDINSKNRNAEIINALLKAMGLRLKFKKIPKGKKFMVSRRMVEDVPNSDKTYKTRILDILGHDDELRFKYGIALRNAKNNIPMVSRKMVERIEDNDPNRISFEKRINQSPAWEQDDSE